MADICQSQSVAILPAMTTDFHFARHLIDRLGYGPRPGDLDAIVRLGADKWIAAQLHPETLPLPVPLSA